MPDFGYDVKLAVIVDGKKKTDMPTSPQGKNGLYYDVQVDCTSSKTQGLWDYNAWRLNLDYIESNSKCNLEFTSTMSKEEYEEYIESGISLRRNTYRGKDITKYKDLHADDPMNLYNQISSGTFADIYVGDYIKGSNGVTWLIADLDNYFETGYNLKLGHHATIIPDGVLTTARMNDKDTTEGGYLNSEMVTKTLGNELVSGQETILSKYIYPDFQEHVLKYESLLSNAIDYNKISVNTKIQEDGTLSNIGGAVSSDWGFASRYLDLMSEVNVFGYATSNTTTYDIGVDSQQYAIFQLRPELIKLNLAKKTFGSYWLRTIFNSSLYVVVGDLGHVFGDHAYKDTPNGVRPRFLIG